ncbi:FecR family protein [Chitinophaga ginsengisegetis]|uniref:FecR family protein n=1 Tax=Chitinophaga ginsengisegetis TaxID=393003 RepID=UPI000DB9E31F|nr:FecR family protein [Chitinophaga ginsengisegetis]MDR6567944.1 ferric-dicitrate binding protein FerR (iron transport regulator) [Chitinophaga ginsengisegetis]MDR6647501.1 ferric-dicitrate binding protein FerR (iron transport regulator) [Chitinophaga ginsengisegetis]MDR6653851.1 ferric-dicitrate binding protein FerR (iron transport regulator) [Chitinophaga ginsengisegetis]
MNQDPDESFLKELFARFLENRCSEEEIILLMEYAEKEEYREIFSEMINRVATEDHPAEEDLYAKHKNVIDGVAARITPPVPVRKEKTHRWLPYQVAAAVAFLLLAGGVWRWYSRSSSTLPVAQHTIAPAPANDAAPAGKKAILILANGASVTLDSVASGLLTRQGQTQIIKSAGGSLLYSSAAGAAAEPLYNSIITPRGGQYQVTLSDGTKVWLNAASTLRFPAAFTGAQRQVTLTGEAYFEVAKNADKPFLVTVNNLRVTVLGTSFNIMAYEDEAAVNTTLLDGAVKVTEGNNATLLQPGEQAQVVSQGNIRVVKHADLNAVMAWKNRLFWFEQDDIHTVMRQLSREYNIAVEIRGNIQRHFTGSIPRDVNVSTVLEVLEKTGGVHFTMNNGKIIVTP